MRAQESDRELDQELAPEQATVTIDDPNRLLPEDLQRKLQALQPGDVQALVTLARMYPDFLDAILTQASSIVGNHTVAQAIEQLTAAPVTAAPDSAEQGEVQVIAPARGRPVEPDYSVEGFDYDSSVLTLEGGDVAGDHVRFILLYPDLRYKVLNGLAHAHPELLDETMERLHVIERGRGDEEEERKETEQQATEGDGQGAAQKAPQGGEGGEKEAAWIVGAKRYNAAHPEQVEEFNQHTKNACMGPEGVLDPKLISDWQAAHGVTPDGRVGPMTVDAARRAAGIGTPVPMPEGDLGLE